MTNYQSIATCACIGENLAYRLPLALGNVQLPTLSVAEIERHLGPATSWEQRRAFEWGLLAVAFRRSGDAERSDYCHGRVAALKKIVP